MLTGKQEAFAAAVASGMNQSDAYRAAYSAEKMAFNSINCNASKLMSDAKVAQRVAELREPAVKRAQMTLESHLDDLKGLRNMAAKAHQYSAAINAEIARGKASGFYVDKVDLTASVGVTIMASPLDEKI